MTIPFMLRLMASSVASTYKASNIVRSVYATGSFEIVNKGIKDIKDFQTKADRDAQQCIISSLSHNFPNLTIIGEEGDLEISEEIQPCYELNEDILNLNCPNHLEEITESETVVWIDPLDGTNEFTEGLISHVTILVGIAVKGVPIGGIICQPFYSDKYSDNDPDSGSESKIYKSIDITQTSTRLIWGLEGLGIFGLLPKLPTSSLSFDKTEQNEFSNIIVTTRSHPSEIVERALNACIPSRILRIGGCGYKILKLLDGTAHAYVFASSGCKKWDTCAPEALLRIAGGSLCNILGSPYDYSKDASYPNSQGVLAAGKKEWLSDYIERIPQESLLSTPTVWLQRTFEFNPQHRGCQYVTEQVKKALPELQQFRVGTLNLFLKHTSASLIISESWDEEVKYDMEMLLNKIIPENWNYRHSTEGPDDMPAHAKQAFLSGSSGITIPITNGDLNLGTYQGIWLCEHRNAKSNRVVVATMHGCLK